MDNFSSGADFLVDRKRIRDEQISPDYGAKKCARIFGSLGGESVETETTEPPQKTGLQSSETELPPRSVGGPSLLELVQKLKAKTINDPKVTKQLMINAQTLLEKCILNREYSSPNSDVFEQVIKHDLKLENAPDRMSGDASINGLNIEIKCSTHAKLSSFNFVQIRPGHNVQCYLFVGYNLWHGDALGKEYLFKIPSEDLYKIVVEHGGYAHGSKTALPAITLATMKGNGYEYALRVDPNTRGRCKQMLWDKLLKYKVEYNPNIFVY